MAVYNRLVTCFVTSDFDGNAAESAVGYDIAALANYFRNLDLTMAAPPNASNAIAVSSGIAGTKVPAYIDVPPTDGFPLAAGVNYGIEI